MAPALRSEFRKLLTVRSTYFVTAFALVITLFVAGFGMSYKQNPALFQHSSFLAENIKSMVMLVALFSGIVAIIQFSHEYRYGTIMHTLTSTSRRNYILLAKIITLSAFAVVFTIIMTVFAGIATYIGVQATAHEMVPQAIPYGELLWKCLFSGWGYAMLGLLFVGLVHNQVAALVTYFMIPLMVEPMSTIVLKDNVVYMPYMAMNAVTSTNTILSPGKAALVFLTYLAVGWVVAWVLFQKRDAN